MTGLARAAEQPAATTAAITVRGLVKHYGKVRAVDGLDLDVPAGSVFGLIGPNGAGKTTTMLALATLLSPDGGELSVFGHDPAGEPRQVRRLVGWMPDFFGLYEGVTCREYLEFFAAAYGIGAGQRRQIATDLLDLVDLGDRAGTDVAGLSRGMQQRLGLARTLVHDPELLILDEPASGLDPRARIELREILLELARSGKTILVSSHILAEMADLCDRVGIIDRGRMLAQGTPEEIRRSAGPVVTVTARVLGDGAALAEAAGVAERAGGRGVTTRQGWLRAEIDGGEEDAAALLSALVAAGVRVASFTEQHGGLERLFMAVTGATREAPAGGTAEAAGGAGAEAAVGDGASDEPLPPIAGQGAR